MQQTVFDTLIQKIVEAFQTKGEKATLKDVLDDTPAFEQAIKADTGGMQSIGRGMPPRGTSLSERYPAQGQAMSEFGNNYAPMSPWGATPPEQLDQTRRDFERESYGPGLDSLKAAFEQTGIPGQADTTKQVGLQNYLGVNIDALNAELYKQNLRNRMGRPPGNQGWR